MPLNALLLKKNLLCLLLDVDASGFLIILHIFWHFPRFVSQDVMFILTGIPILLCVYYGG